VNVPAVLAILVPGRRVLDESRSDAAAGRIDTVGAAAVTGGLVLVLLAVSSAPDRHWSTTAATAAGGAALLVAFAAREVHLADPLVPAVVTRSRPVVVANAAVAFQSMIGIAWLYVLTLYFQDVLDRRPLAAGLLFAPMTVAAVAAATSAGWLVSRGGVRPAAITGVAVVAIGVVIMISGLTAEGELALVLTGMVVGEAGFMLANVALTMAGTSAVSDDRAGVAAGLLNTSMQLGGAWGLCIVATVVSATLAAGDTGAYAAALRWGLVTCLAFCASSLVLVTIGLRAPRVARRGSDSPAER
jgi:hypothetical protein